MPNQNAFNTMNMPSNNLNESGMTNSGGNNSAMAYMNMMQNMMSMYMKNPQM